MFPGDFLDYRPKLYIIFQIMHYLTDNYEIFGYKNAVE